MFLLSYNNKMPIYSKNNTQKACVCIENDENKTDFLNIKLKGLNRCYIFFIHLMNNVKLLNHNISEMLKCLV